MPDHQTSPVGEDAERAAFEAWHRSKFATKYSTGQPTRDMHNGTYAEQYGPEKQQLMWEAWLAARRAAPTQPKAQVGTIEDYAQFHVLHSAWMSARDYWQDDAAEQVAEAWRKFIDYIDAWAGSRAGDAVRLFLGAAYPVSKEIDSRGYCWSEAYLDQARELALTAPAPGKQAGNDQGAAA